MKIQSRLGVTIGAGTGCNCGCYASIVKLGSNAELFTEGCVGFTIEWQKYSVGSFGTDQTGGTTYDLIGVTEPIRVKLTSDDCCTKFSNVL